MYVRYQHARTGGVLAVIAGLVGGGASVMSADDEPAPAAHEVVADPGLAAARMFMEDRATGAKAKDVLGGDGPKINLYDDDGDGTWDRGKVDRDRDDSWDAYWTRDSGRLLSHDEKRGIYHQYASGTWQLMNKPVPVPRGPTTVATVITPDAPEWEPSEWVPMVRRLLESPASGEKRKDALFGDGPKVNLYDDDQDGRWDRAKVDRDRDDTWDEKWSREGSVLSRKDVATGARSVFTGDGWRAE